MCWREVKHFFLSIHKPKLSVPPAEPLSPCIIDPYIKEDGKYEENKGYIPVSLLLKAIDNDRMTNIAVAGNYGVGKSSIINTAENKLKRWIFPKHRFIKISLASLLTHENELPGTEQEGKQIKKKGVKKDDLENGEKESVECGFTERQIEYSILQQILYHDNPQKTPKSRIRRIHKTRWEKPYLISALCIFVFVSLLLLLQPSWFLLSDYFDVENADKGVKAVLKWGPFVVLGVVFILACRYIGRHYSFFLARVGYKDVEMKVKEEMSIFNAYMDEIVYFFESTKYDVVVFEDLDRFENREVIFYKLRELNMILNNSRSIKRRINFVYAVLDDLFNPTERVKFFDYIITVIPVINSLNSYEQLMECIKPHELFNRLGKNELRNLCDYLQDMRLLLNIVNEFNQFVPLLDTSVMSEKILFGLIVYKNYVPSDFSLMYNRDGVVARVIEGVDEIRPAIIHDKKLVVQTLLKEINSIQEEHMDAVVQLRNSLLDKGIEFSNNTKSNLKISIDGKPYLIDAVAKSSLLFDKVRKDEASYIITNIYGAVNVKMPLFSVVESNMGEVDYYVNSFNSLKSNSDSRIAIIEQRIQSLNKEIESFPTTVQGVYQANPSILEKSLETFHDEFKAKLVKFLILNGYFDHHYQYYISYFYPNALKREDRIFVMKAGRHEGEQYNTKLERLDEVIKRFTPQDFGTNPSLLNVNLLREIYQNPQYEQYRSCICQLLSTTKKLDFVICAYKTEPAVKNSFFYQLLREYDFWGDITSYHDEQQDLLREIYVRFCELREGKVNPDFKNWLPENYAFFDKKGATITDKRIIGYIFKHCNPVFKVLKLRNTSDEVLLDIMENQRYEFSRQNMNAIIRRLGFFNRYSVAAYSSLREASVSALLKRVESNWANALRSVFPETSLREDSPSQTVILNHAETQRNVVLPYLAKQRTRIKLADQISDNVLGFAFRNNLVEASWRNIYYYSIKKAQGLPLSFLYNNNIHERVCDALSIQEEGELCLRIVFSNSVKLTKYEELVPLFTTPFRKISNRIQPARMKYLIDNGFLDFNEENYKFVKESYSGLSGGFLAKNVRAFMLAPEKYNVSNKDAVAALNAMDTKKSQCDFIRAIAGKNVIPDLELISAVKPFVMNGNLKVGEIGFRLLTGIIASSNLDERVLLGRRAIVSLPYDKDNVSAILRSMGDEYQRLTSDSTVSTMSYSRDAILVVNELVKNGHFKASEKRGTTIVIYKR